MAIQKTIVVLVLERDFVLKPVNIEKNLPVGNGSNSFLKRLFKSWSSAETSPDEGTQLKKAAQGMHI